MKSATKNINKSKNILITGGAGFIASNFINYWVNKYPSDNLIILDLLSYAANLSSINSLIEKKRIEFLYIDSYDS